MIHFLSAVSVHDAQSRCVKKHLMFTAVNIFFQFYDSLTVAENPFLDLYQANQAIDSEFDLRSN